MIGQFRTLSPAAIAALLLAGCGSGPPAETLNVSDDNAFQPVLRGSISLSEPSRAPSHPQSGHAVELGYARASGHSEQQLSSGYVSLGSRTFTAPATLSNEFEMRYVDVTYRFRYLPAHSSAGVELLAGVAFADVDFAATSAGLRASESLSSPGGQLGLGVLWRPFSGTGVHARASGFFSGDDAGITRATRIDVYLSQALLRNVALRGGYSWWTLESDRGGATSPVEIEFRGPVLGLEVMF